MSENIELNVLGCAAISVTSSLALKINESLKLVKTSLVNVFISLLIIL